MNVVNPNRAGALGKKILVLGLILFAVNIPRWALSSLGQERETYYQEAVEKIVQGFASPQRFGGVTLSTEVVYQKYEPKKDGEKTSSDVKRELVFRPESASTDLKLEFQERQKGIFRVPVFLTKGRIDGRFAVDDAELFTRLFDNDKPQTRPRLMGASLRFPLDDVRRLTEFKVKVNGRELVAQRRTDHFEVRLPSEMLQMPLKLEIENTFGLRGFRDLTYTPSGEQQDDLRLVAPWSSPAFEQALPSEYSIESGVTSAKWSFTGGDTAQAAVVKFYEPGTVYQMSERSRKYGAFIIVFMLISFFVYEVLGALRLHFMHYLLLMLPVSLFFLLQLALAEHIGFGPAYAIATGAVVIMMTLYLRGIRLRTSAALSFGALETAIFGMIYVILESTDYALLMGALALFFILGGAMFLTRKVDWEALDGTRTKTA